MSIRRLPRGQDEGFTLPELLISTVIVGIVLGAVVSAIILALRTHETRTRLIESHDEQLTAAYLARDVASVEKYADRPLSPCGSGATLAMTWNDPVVGDIYVDYVLDTAQTPAVLQRYACTGLGAAQVVTLASNVQSLSCTDDSGTDISCPSGTDSRKVIGLSVTELSGRTFTLYGKRRTL